MTTAAQRLEPVDWETVYDAVIDWLVDVSQLVPRAIWEKQRIPQPDYPYASILMTTAPIKIGGKDEMRTSTDMTREAGSEMELLTTGPREFVMTIAFHVDEGNGAPDPSRNAMFLASRALASLGQLTVIGHFDAVGMAIVKELGVQDTSLVINGEWLSRASLDVRFRVASVMTEYTGFIQKVEIRSEDLGIDETLDASV